MARLHARVVRLERRDVRRARRVHAAVGGQVAEERELADAAVLQLRLRVGGRREPLAQARRRPGLLLRLLLLPSASRCEAER